MVLIQKYIHKILAISLTILLWLNFFTIKVYAEEEKILDVGLIDKGEIEEVMDEELVKTIAAITDKVGIYELYKMYGLAKDNNEMANMFLPDEMKSEWFQDKVNLEEQDGELLKQMIENSINPWNLYGEEITDFISEKYDGFIIDDSSLDKKFSFLDDVADYSQLALNMTKVLNDINTDEVDGTVHLYVSGLNLITSLVEAAELDNSVLVKGSLGICDAATKYADSVMSSNEYKEFKAQYDTKLGFTVGFLSSAGEGLWDLYSGLGDEINRFIHDEELWDMIFPHRKDNDGKGDIEKTVTGYRAPAPYSISGFAPAPTRFGGYNGAHVIVEWGTNINDLNVTYNN